MVEEPLVNRPDIISEFNWIQFTDKQKRIIACMVMYLEFVPTRRIKEGASLRSLRADELTTLNAKLARLSTRLQISYQEEQEPYRITWKLGRRYTT